MVSVARRRNLRHIGNGQTALVRASADTLPFAAQSFDKVLSVHTFYFWREPLNTLRDLHRMLRPNGALAIPLCTGRVVQGAHVYGPLQRTLETDILPEMHRIGFASARLVNRPDSRDDTSAAILARR